MESLELEQNPLPAPVVSVTITTYNLAKWLPRALDSVLGQRTDFPFEIVISDDCSRDETIEVAHSYRDRHPNVIKVLERPHNIGIQNNYYDAFATCRGKYIAWLDNDDYWTDPQKLAIQVAALESDTSISACCSYVRWVRNDGEVDRVSAPSMPPGRYGLEAILRRNFIATPSVMFRNGIQRQLPGWYFDLAPISDWPIWVLAALSGDILLLDRVTADYTLHPVSNFAAKGPIFSNKMDAEFLDKVESILPQHWHRLVRAEKGKRYETISYLLREQGDFSESRRAAIKAFGSPALLDNIGSKTKTLLAAFVREMQSRR